MKIEANLNNKNIDALINTVYKEQDEFSIMMKRYITQLHDAVIKEFGGAYGIRDNALLESVAVAPFQSVFGTDLYPDVYSKAAKYIYDFADYQVFIDGNKRTGLAVCEQFLYANGLELDMTEQEKYTLVMDIANKRLQEVKNIAHIIKDNVINYDLSQASIDLSNKQVELEL